MKQKSQIWQKITISYKQKWKKVDSIGLNVDNKKD